MVGLNLKMLIAISAVSLLVACGGGSSSSSSAAATPATTSSSGDTNSVITTGAEAEVTCNGACISVSADADTSNE